MRAELSDAVVTYELAGAGPRMVWCHGLASCRDGDRDVIEAFARDFEVLAYDARGHGESPPVRDAGKYSYAALSRDLRELMDLVGWPEAILAGASMGAATVIRVAMEEPGRARAVIMARPGSGGGPAPARLQALFRLGAAAIRAGGLEGALRFLMTIPEAREELVANPERLEGLRRDWGRHDPLSIAAALEGIPSSAPLTSELDPPSITAPVLVIPGNDALHPTEAGLRCVELIPTARGMPPFDSLPREQETARFAETVRAYLAEHGLA
jgi:3-oxoadipate enol-lactonase